jgi:hypothetical protein
VTAFTVAHSITLAAATSTVNVPGPPVEAAIALSIVLVAVERRECTARDPFTDGALAWLVASALDSCTALVCRRPG